MDANKLTKLSAINYSIKPSCGLCIYSLFPNDDWGLCAMHNYNHLKHNGQQSLSIHRLGSCPDFEFAEDKARGMEHYDQFIEKKI